MVVSLVGVLALTLTGWWISRSTRIGRQLGTTMVVVVIGFLVTNVTGWQPQTAAAAASLPRGRNMAGTSLTQPL